MSYSSRRGFTLIEILIVLSIMGIIIGMTTMYFPNVNLNARNTRRQIDMEQVRVALESARNADVNASYPEGDEFEATLVPQYLNELPVDPRTRVTYDFHYEPTCAGTPAVCNTYTMYLDLEPGNEFVVSTPLGTQVPATHP